MANTRIGRTVSVAGSRRKATFSAWVKRTGLGESWIAKFGGDYSQGQLMQIGFNSADNCFIVGDIPTASATRLESTRKFRDTNAWYHYVVAFDTEQATASNRLKFYINGEQITSFGTETYPTQNLDLAFNRTGTYNNAWLGGRGESSYEFSGIMSHVHWCDGYAYDASAFGSTDATTGEWKINTSPSVSYGTNGYFMLKDGNSLTDASGNGNNFSSLVGTLTKTEDNPSNVFATLNPLEKLGSNLLIYAGNTAAYNTSSDWRTMISNLAFPNTGKFYAEMKVEEVSSAVQVGIMAQSSFSGAEASQLGQLGQYNSYGYKNNGEKISNSSSSSYGNSFAGGIIGIAVDMDNKNIYFSKDGVWQNSGNPESGATGTGAAFTDLQNDKDYMFAAASQGSNPEVFWNFGNGIFDRTLVSSAGTNASGIGIFEDDVPTGYTALSTKGLNL